MSTTRRRSAGEGGIIGPYTTKAGKTRYAAKFNNADGKQVVRRRDENGRPFTRKSDVAAYLRRTINKVERGEWAEASSQPLGEYLDEWAAGLRLAPSTIASYRKNIRLHLKPRLGTVPLAKLTATRIDQMYRELETTGRRDHKAGGPLSLRTVAYVHTILRAALQDAVRRRLLQRNPADDAKPPTAKQARAQSPEMHPWTPAQLRAFLGWAAEHSPNYTAWLLLAMTGMRRGELIGLRWRHVDLDAGTVSVRRSATLVKTKGEGERMVEGPTKGRESRVVDLDDTTVAALKAWRSERAGLMLTLVKPEALVFTDADGGYPHPERFSRAFTVELARCRTALGDDAPPVARLHDLRHTHASVLLQNRTPVKVVSERLGHASATITLGVYAHVMPGDQRDAADTFARLVAEE